MHMYAVLAQVLQVIIAMIGAEHVQKYVMYNGALGRSVHNVTDQQKTMKSSYLLKRGFDLCGLGE